MKVIDDKIKPVKRNPGWVHFGRIEAFDVIWLIIQGSEPNYEIHIRQYIPDERHGMLVGGEPDQEQWKHILRYMRDIGFVTGDRRKAAIVMSSWEERPSKDITKFPCILNPVVDVDTQVCHTCLLRRDCYSKILTFEIDRDYMEDIEAAKKHARKHIRLH